LHCPSTHVPKSCGNDLNPLKRLATISERRHALDPAPAFDPAAFVISANVHRRQLSTTQQRDFIAKLIEDVIRQFPLALTA
jgi:hypothetical protein